MHRMDIKILGTGCEKCKKLYQLTQEVVSSLGVNATFQKTEDIKQIMQYGVMCTPALVINEKVMVYGRVPNKEELSKYIEEYL